MSPRIARTRFATVAAVVMAAACSEAPDAMAPNSRTEPAFTVAEGHVGGIEALIATQEAAWAAKDAVAYAANYTEDAEVIAPIAQIVAGRAAVQGQHVFLFNPVTGIFRASTQSLSLRSLTFLTGTIALVKLDVTLTGFHALPPGLRESEPGVVRTRVTWVAVKRGPQWRILFQQMTPFPPAP
jgi:uncharacterized protein (TIGR02246 family)